MNSGELFEIKKQSLDWDRHICDTKYQAVLDKLEQLNDKLEELKTRDCFCFGKEDYQVNYLNERFIFCFDDIRTCLEEVCELEKEREGLNLKLSQLKENTPVIV